MSIERVDPSGCTLWRFHERIDDELSSGSCEELIRSIGLHGQRHPALGRRIEAGGGPAVELIYGARRLFAAKELGSKLLVDIRALDDRAAVVEMEIENRLRADVSPYERGMSYRRWLVAGLFNSQAELAKEIGISEAQVSRLLKYADLPAGVVAAFDSPHSIKEEWAVVLAKSCRDPERRSVVMRRARIAANHEQPPSASAVFRRLISEDTRAPRKHLERRDEVVTGLSGTPLFRMGFRATTLHFIVPRGRLSEHLINEIKANLVSILQPVAVVQPRHTSSIGERRDVARVVRTTL